MTGFCAWVKGVWRGVGKFGDNHQRFLKGALCRLGRHDTSQTIGIIDHRSHSIRQIGVCIGVQRIQKIPRIGGGGVVHLERQIGKGNIIAKARVFGHIGARGDQIACSLSGCKVG